MLTEFIVKVLAHDGRRNARLGGLFYLSTRRVDDVGSLAIAGNIVFGRLLLSALGRLELRDGTDVVCD